MSSSNNSDNSESIAESASPMSPVSMTPLKHIENMDKLVVDNPQFLYDAECVRKRSNWSKGENAHKFDHPEFDAKKLLEDIPSHSAKLQSLLQKIKDLDKKDMARDGRQYKHFIFSDVKSGTYGAKLVASALIASGMNLAYHAPLKKGKATEVSMVPKSTLAAPPSSLASTFEESNPAAPPNSLASEFEESNPAVPPNSLASESDNESITQEGGASKAKTYGKIALLEDEELLKSPGNNFFLLASIGVYEQPISVGLKKSILKKFNQRTENVHGDLARIIVMDSGYKEGIDLFDIKYIHIYEPPVNMADQKQVIGRGTRTCGQKGLEFHPTQGWPLHVFIYDTEVPEQMRNQMLGSASLFDLYLKAMNIDIRLFNFQHDLERASVFGSVDYDLNKAIHSFSVQPDSPKSAGGPKIEKKRRIVVREDLPVLTLPAQVGELVFAHRESDSKPIGHDEMRARVQKHFGDFKWTDVKMENNCAPKTGGAEIMTYTPTQDFVRHYFTPENPVKGMLLFHSVGTGKCHAKDTPILLHDGRIKMVQDIDVGDILMGDDSTPRKVLSLASGQDDMYKINPVKGESYTVNSEHILCLKHSGRGSITYIKSQTNSPHKTTLFDTKNLKYVAKSFATREEAEAYLPDVKEEDKIIEIEVKKYLQLSNSIKRELKGYRKGVEFPDKPVDMDPYIIGLWIGDGGSRDPVITNQDATILKYLRDTLPTYNVQLVHQSDYTYRISSFTGKPNANAFWNAMKKYNLYENKHIPYDYKCNSRENRMKLLAGIIDSDGYYCNRGKVFSISQKSNAVSEDILYLARSLGFAAYSSKSEKSCMYKGEKRTGIYNSISISGNGLEEIPTLVHRKKAEKRTQIKDAMLTGITVESVGKGDYYGFTLDGNNRYLMGDFTVTHNTCSAIAAASSSFEEQGYTILWVTRTTLKNDIWKNMFDQVCSETIKKQIESGVEIPDDNAKRMRLLSKSWSIRPMSYKQFSNLVTKANSFYKSLVKKNGEADPLRKTLLIIDEAHKLYGGGDLSSIERPDMNALQNALQQSYAISGNDSVKLLLMTATPITENPMELIQLINLTKPVKYQMPNTFDEFSKEYLDEFGRFTPEGERNYLDDIAGHLSYLNREKDARQFAQPIVRFVQSPLIDNIDTAMKFDRKYVREIMDSEVNKLKTQVATNNAKIDDDLKDIDATRFGFLAEKCEGYEGKVLKACNKVVKANIKEVVKDAKAAVKDVKESIKALKEQITAKKGFKQEFIAKIPGNQENLPEEYAKFKETMFYAVKNKCGKKINNMAELKEALKDHPSVLQFDEQMREFDAKIDELKQNLQTALHAYKGRMTQLKGLMKQDLTELESNVVRMVIKDQRKTTKKYHSKLEKEYEEGVAAIRKTRKAIEKKKQKKIQQIRKTMKEHLKEEGKVTKQIEKEEKALRKTQRKQGVFIKTFENEMLKDLVEKYSKLIDDELDGLKEEIENQEREKAEKKAAKEQAKVEKKAEKQQEKVAKQKEKKHLRETQKIQKAMEKQEERAEKQQQKIAKKEQARTQKLAEKAEKAKNGTKKNQPAV